MILKFLKKDVYGRPLYFPMCDKSKKLLDAFPHVNGPRKSLSERQVEGLKDMEVQIQLYLQ